MRLLFVTGNAHKMGEIREILKDLPFEIVSAKEAGIDFTAEENGSTFAENALIKARAVGALPNTVVMADDSGLSIDALGGQPGIHSARFLGEDTPYPVKHAYLLEKLAGKREKERSAHFSCVIAMIFPDGTEKLAEGRFDGEIATEVRGTHGFGYDPIFFVPSLGKTAAELSAEEKNALSHRGRALAKASKILLETLQSV